MAALGISKSDLYNAAQLVHRKITLTEEHQVSVQDSEDSTEFTMNFKQFAVNTNPLLFFLSFYIWSRKLIRGVQLDW